MTGADLILTHTYARLRTQNRFAPMNQRPSKFNVAVSIDDNLRNLHLKLFAVEFNDKALIGKNIISFKPADKNFVGKKLKEINI